MERVPERPRPAGRNPKWGTGCFGQSIVRQGAAAEAVAHATAFASRLRLEWSAGCLFLPKAPHRGLLHRIIYCSGIATSDDLDVGPFLGFVQFAVFEADSPHVVLPIPFGQSPGTRGKIHPPAFSAGATALARKCATYICRPKHAPAMGGEGRQPSASGPQAKSAPAKGDPQMTIGASDGTGSGLLREQPESVDNTAEPE